MDVCGYKKRGDQLIEAGVMIINRFSSVLEMNVSKKVTKWEEGWIQK